MTQAGTKKLIDSAMQSKEVAERWRSVAAVLADALSLLDFNDVDDTPPYSQVEEIAKCVKGGDLSRLCKILNIG